MIPAPIPMMNKSKGPGWFLESKIEIIAIAGATPNITFLFMVIVSDPFFILL